MPSLKMGLVEHSQLTGAFEKSMEWLGQGNLIHLPHYTPLYYVSPFKNPIPYVVVAAMRTNHTIEKALILEVYWGKGGGSGNWELQGQCASSKNRGRREWADSFLKRD